VPGSRESGGRRALAAILVALLLASVGHAERAGAPRGRMQVEGLTFVASRNSTTRLVLRAETARLGAGESEVELEGAELELPPATDFGGLALRADRGRIQLDSSDFRLEGDLVGRLADGRELRLAWVGYDAARSLLYSDAAITIDEPSARYRAGGLRYRIDRGQLQLLGGVEVIRGR